MTSKLTDHADFGCSGIEQVVQCPGSWRMQKKYPGDPTSTEAEEGNAGHWAMAEVMAKRPVCEGLIAPNGIPLTTEMCDGAEMYYDTLAPNPAGCEYHVEERVEASEHIDPDNWGTPDTWLYNPYLAPPPAPAGVIGGTLYVRDYKFGHRHVEAFENWQLINYVLLLLAQLGVDGMRDQFIKVIIEIVQPRSYHRDGPVRTWTVMASELRAHENTIRAAIIEAKKPDAPCRTGSACRDCTARAFCPTLQQDGLGSIDEAGKSVPLELPLAALGMELRYAARAMDRLKSRLSGLQALATATIKSGKAVPGFALEQGNGRERWNKPLPEVLALGTMMNVDISKPQAMTPKQAIEAGIPAEIVSLYTDTPKGELKLVEDDGSAARKFFGSK